MLLPMTASGSHSHMDEPNSRRAINLDSQASLRVSSWGARVLTRMSFLAPLVRTFQNRSIEHRVLAGFGLVFAGILVISAISYRNMTILIRNSQQDQRSHEFIQFLAATSESMDEAESSHRRFLVTGDDEYLASYENLRTRAPEYIGYLRNLTDGGGIQRARVNQLEQLITQQLQKERTAIEKRKEKGFESVRTMALAGVAKAELDSA